MLSRSGLSPLKLPAHAKVWHWTEPATALLTSEVTCSDAHAANPPDTEIAQMPVRISCLIIRAPSSASLSLQATRFERLRAILVDLGGGYGGVRAVPVGMRRNPRRAVKIRHPPHF